MALGIGIGIGINSRGRAAFTPRALAGCEMWCRDDDPGVVEAGGLITSIPNRGTLGGSMAAVNAAADSTLNGKRAKLFDGTNDYYASSLAASSFTGYSNGGSSTIVTVTNLGANATQNILGTNDGNANNVGLLLSYNGGTNRRFVFRIGNGSGTNCLILPLTTGHVAESTTAVVTARWGVGETNELDVRVNGSSVGTASFTDTPSSDAPNFTLRWGALNSSLQGYGSELAMYSSYLSDTNVAAVEQYMADRWGVTL